MRKRTLAGLLIALALAGCSISPEAARETAQAVTQTRGVLDSIAASTRAAMSQQTTKAPPSSSPSAPLVTATDSRNQTAVEKTPTAAQVWVEVRIDTNCRLGPGLAFEMVGALFVGERTIVLQRSSVPDYWVVENPDRPGHTCYLWGKYATLEGDIGSLPLDIPPTATAQPASILGWVYLDLNENGIRDPEETGPGPEGLRLLLKIGACPGEATLRVVDPNAYGRIMIQPLLAGVYCLVADPEATTLEPEQREIQLGPNEQLDEVNFRLLP